MLWSVRTLLNLPSGGVRHTNSDNKGKAAQHIMSTDEGSFYNVSILQYSKKNTLYIPDERSKHKQNIELVFI